MATTISISNSFAWKDDAGSSQRGYVGYYDAAYWGMRYKFTTPSSTITSLTFRSYWYQYESFSSYPVLATVSTNSSLYTSLTKNSSYMAKMTASSSGSYNVAVTISDLSLSPNTTYYLFLWPGTTSTHRHLAHNSNAGQTNYLEGVTHTHSYSSVVTAPTCTAQGYTTHTCSCGDSYKDTYTAVLGHSYSSTTTAPTCTTQGYTTYTCTVCGYSYESDYINALGHSWDDGVITAEPTDSEDGLMTYTCNRCGATKIEAIQKLGANLRIVPVVFIGGEEYIPYIYKSSSWDVYIPNIYNGTNFEPY